MTMQYRQSGHSGIQLPVMSLGLWHNFGANDDYGVARDMVLTAFDRGICHFDLANNYGPPPGSAELTFGRIMKDDLHAHRDEMLISSKAGHDMWNGVYGTGSSRKNIMASCDQSLRRTGLEYFDVFYSHRYDPATPIEETMQALVDLVRQGKALYVGISKYPADKQREAYAYLQREHVPCLLSQYRYSMFDLKARQCNFDLAVAAGSGIICFSPLAQGLLTGKYLDGIPADSRVAKHSPFLTPAHITPKRLEAVRQLGVIAANRGQSLAQMALAWVLAEGRVTSVIIGTSSVNQLESNLSALDNPTFTTEELNRIDEIISIPEISF